MNEFIATYIDELNKQFATGNAREHAYRPALKALIEHLLPSGYVAVNEPRHVECGAPDYLLMYKELPVAYAEAKDLNDPDLEGKNKHKDQFNRYKQSLNSLFFTDYLDFHFYNEGEKTTAIRLAKIEGNKIVVDDAFDELRFIQVIREWASAKPQLITSSRRLAERMASKAQLLAHTIEQSLLDDKKNDYQVTPLWLQLNAFKQALVSDLDEHKFADLYAQTIAYGLFAARINDKSPLTFTRHEAATLIPHTNPFLRDAFQHIAGYNIDPRIAWIVDDLVETFAATNMQKVMRGFKRDTRQTDPILHFYEDFLHAYDPKQKKSAGVYYTPEPIVDFIVRAVDEILKKEFGISKGLADTSKTDFEIRDEEEGKMVAHTYNLHRVQILDPATGTGTFLAAIVRHIKNTMSDNMGAWNQYVVQHLLPRLYGFELMMAPYTIAHLKMDLEMAQADDELLSSDDRVKIYLTNSLKKTPIIEKTALGSIIAKEANEANLIKHNAPVMIVMGNPPYSVSSNNKGKGFEWISGLLNDYKKNLNEKKINLDDDYIKFIRLAQYYVERNGEGIVAYISNNSFLYGGTHRQMRRELLRCFDDIYILNLHGDSRRNDVSPDGSKDENVFSIMQGVSINIFIKKHDSTPSTANIHYFDLYGSRKEKYAFLLDHSITDTAWKIIAPKDPKLLFIPKDLSAQEEYDKGFRIDELMKINNSGVKTDRDTLFYDYDKETLEKRIQYLLGGDLDKEFIEKYRVIDSSSYKLRERLKNAVYSPQQIVKSVYRPLDFVYTYYDEKLISRPAYSVMRHMLRDGKNIGLVVTKQNRQLSLGYFYITDCLLDIHVLDSASDSIRIFPLYLYPEPVFGEEQERIPNIDDSIWETIENWVEYGQAFAPTTTTESAGLLDFDKPKHHHTLNPEQILDYIYGVVHSPAYRERFKEYIKEDIPRIPYPKNADEFEHFRMYGEQLRKLHIMDVTTIAKLEEKYKGIATFNHKGSDIIEQCVFSDDTQPSCVCINATQSFDNVPREAWEFLIGGHQPALKWLKDRKDRILSYDDMKHYRHIIMVLIETAEIMNQIG